jgi:hypothetical protein
MAGNLRLPTPTGRVETPRRNWSGAETLLASDRLARPSLPEPVVRFIEKDIHSVLQLEVLLLLRERPGPWTADAVATELRITQQSAELRMGDLRDRQLLVVTAESGAYTYSPATRELGLLVDALAECYATMRHTVINLMFSVPRDGARVLAEAFRFRRKRGD